MERKLLRFLRNWLIETNRKPLVIRGARQVGKTWLVKHLAKIENKKLFEINFEKNPSLIKLFTTNDPNQILINLMAHFQKKIITKESILFLDEIQAASELLSKLRWFYEDLPELPVIAAGSLLEFILENHAFSMPVGRINYVHLEPMSFEEFLLANNKPFLIEYLMQYTLGIEIPISIHDQFNLLFREYLIVGGMPAAVKSWITDRELIKINQIQNDLLATYRDDFAKYKKRIEFQKMDEVLTSIPKMLGQKFVYSKINPEISNYILKQALNLLNQARICHKILHTAANGLPLAAEIKEKFFKEIFLDTGLCCMMLGLNLEHISEIKDLTLINHGGISEQIVGQMLRTVNPPFIEPRLYYWTREEKGSSAEIDYIIQFGNKLIPIEVKAGSTGSLKSLHLFMELKKLSLAVRINSDVPSITNINTKSRTGYEIKYKLISLPFYLLEQLNRILKAEITA